MNDHEAARIAAAMNQMRPDWPIKQLATLLRDERIVSRPRRDVAVALAWVACETNSASPYRVLENGPWWRAVAVEGGAAVLNTFDHTIHCGTCAKPNDARHPTDHVFVSALDERRAQVDADKVAAAIQYARSGIGDAKAEPPAVEEPPAKESLPEVDRLRAALTRHQETADEGAVA